MTPSPGPATNACGDHLPGGDQITCTREYAIVLSRLDADIGSALLAVEETRGHGTLRDEATLRGIGASLRAAGRKVERLCERHGVDPDA